jgi:hypothetical protein
VDRKYTVLGGHSLLYKELNLIKDLFIWLWAAGVAQSVLCLTPDWTTGVRSPTEAEGFSSSLCVQTGSAAHPASCTKGTGGPFPGSKGVKRGLGGGVTLTTHPHLVPRLRMSRSYTSSHPMRLHGVQRDHFTYFYFIMTRKHGHSY